MFIIEVYKKNLSIQWLHYFHKFNLITVVFIAGNLFLINIKTSVLKAGLIISSIQIQQNFKLSSKNDTINTESVYN